MTAIETQQLLDNPPICPNCNTQTWWNFDMNEPWIWHLHCDNCHIDIHGNYVDEIVKQFNLHHKPYTCILMRGRKINIIFENGIEIREEH